MMFIPKILFLEELVSQSLLYLFYSFENACLLYSILKNTFHDVLFVHDVYLLYVKTLNSTTRNIIFLLNFDCL